MVTETLTRPAPVIGTSPTYDVVDAEATEETPPLMVPPEAMPQIDHLITEDDTPVDNIFSEKQQRLLTEPLHSTWRQTMTQDRPFVVFANVGLFYTTRKQAVVPDVMLSMDVEPPDEFWSKPNRSYFIWEYGKPPDVVIEIVSNIKGGEDSRKLRLYAWLGIDYYIIYDPLEELKGGVLRVYGLRDGVYQPLDSGWLPQVGLGVTLWQGIYEGWENTWLRWCYEDGTVIPTGKEWAEQVAQQAEQAAQQAEQAVQQAEQAQRERDEQLRTTARNLLALLSDEQISQTTGMPLEQVRELRKDAG